MVYHDEKIVLWGMSCAGKTTFARRLPRPYYCFDALFPWHDIETLGLSISAALRQIQTSCPETPFVLDGWHLADRQGLFLPVGSCVYVVYADYARIIRQYRVPVDPPNCHLPMFGKWYGTDFSQLPQVRYFENRGEFLERSPREFADFVNQSLIKTKSRNDKLDCQSGKFP